MRLLRLISYVWNHQLNQNGRLSAIGRLLRWQLASRLLPGPIALQFVDDTTLFASRGMTGATGNWYCGLHEAEEMGFILHFLRPHDLFLDIGANIGSYTVLAAGAVGSRVISVEPIPTTFSNLERNVFLNGLECSVDLHCIGLSSESSELLFTSDQDTVNHVVSETDQGPAIRVPVTLLDELLAGRVPRAIKIDVEGHELAVLKGARKTLADPALAAVVMEVNGSGDRYGISDEEVLTEMLSYGFSPYGYDPFKRQLLDWNSSIDNAIFLRSRSDHSSTLVEARRYRLINRLI